jgi:hypothetical protein
MILAAILAASAVITPYQEAAYVAGRCRPWMTTFVQAETEKSMDGIGGDLREWYAQGIKDTLREPLSAETCERAMANARKRIDEQRNTAR